MFRKRSEDDRRQYQNEIQQIITDKYNEYLKENNQYYTDECSRTIVLLGRPQSGKSTIMNVLTDPRHIADDVNTRNSTMQDQVTSITLEHSNMKLTVIEPSNLLKKCYNAVFQQKNYVDLTEIINYLQSFEIHLAFYCVDFNVGLTTVDIEILETIINCFKSNNCLYVIITHCESKDEIQRRQYDNEILNDSYFNSINKYLHNHTYFSGCINHDDWNNCNDTLIDQFDNICGYRHLILNLMSDAKESFKIECLTNVSLSNQRHESSEKITTFKKQSSMNDASVCLTHTNDSDNRMSTLENVRSRSKSSCSSSKSVTLEKKSAVSENSDNDLENNSMRTIRMNKMDEEKVDKHHKSIDVFESSDISIDDLTSEIQRLRKQYNEQVNRLNEQIQRLERHNKEDNQRLKDEIRRLTVNHEEEKTNTSKTIQHLTILYENANKQIQQLTNEKINLTQKIEQLNGIMVDYMEKNKCLSQEKKRLEEDVRRFGDQNDQLQSENQRTVPEIVALTTAREELNRPNETSRSFRCQSRMSSRIVFCFVCGVGVGIVTGILIWIVVRGRGGV